MIVIYIILYVIGFYSIWKLDKGSIRNKAFTNFNHNIRNRIILSLFSWVLLAPFLIVCGIAWLIDSDNV